MILTEEILIQYGFEKCLTFRDDIYSGEKEQAHYSFKKQWFDCDMVLYDIFNSLESNIVKKDTIGKHGFDVYGEYENNKVHIATLGEVQELQLLWFASMKEWL